MLLVTLLCNCMMIEIFSQGVDSTHQRFESISPSAYALLKLKAHTSIPFAKETASYFSHESFAGNEGKTDVRKLIHFENRYRTVDKMLARFSSSNILEFSSGYSFRGLALCRDSAIYFIDTDLPDVIARKKGIMSGILRQHNLSLQGKLELLPLNVFDVVAFISVTDRFPEGPVTLVNEGLLPYFNDEEKRSLCRSIHEVLTKRGGYWITADIYIKDKTDSKDSGMIESSFRREHHLDENRFESYPAAEAFFKDCGFEVVARETIAEDKLSSLALLSEEKRKRFIRKMKAGQSVRQTWCLRVK